jgi:transcriptional regulator with XRE-family HTH domain
VKTVALRLKELRERYGYSQAGMAKAVGMEQTAWSRWERNPPEALLQLRNISEYYGISADYLLGLSDNPILTDRLFDGVDPDTIAALHSVTSQLPDNRREEWLRIGEILLQSSRQHAELMQVYDRMMNIVEQLGGADAVAALETALRADAAGDTVRSLRLIDAFFAGRNAKKELEETSNQG